MIKRFRDLKPKEFIVVGVDTATGGPDYCAAQFLSKTKLDVPIVYHKQVIATEMTPVIHRELEAIFDKTGVRPVVAYERNNGGLFELERLASLNRANKYDIFQMYSYGKGDNSPTDKLGWDTNTATRPKMLTDLKEAIDKRVIGIYDRATVNEMFAFIINQKSSSWKAEAEKGAHDDLIMALAIAWQLYQSEEPPRDINEVIQEFPDEKLFNEGGFY